MTSFVGGKLNWGPRKRARLRRGPWTPTHARENLESQAKFGLKIHKNSQERPIGGRSRMFRSAARARRYPTCARSKDVSSSARRRQFVGAHRLNRVPPDSTKLRHELRSARNSARGVSVRSSRRRRKKMGVSGGVARVGGPLEIFGACAE
ncbi:hypothetical protein AAFF_G00057450 [Aldrovandia affinis]|uniref:Uncharacterized protein n=1 Tax=Aldrovandia affinis TaxID=143900 RepID=A0AAD7R1W4_9TELE|nr:hypothetical protein AAFF_G00057450 [Aldrovandia affinis]